MNDITKAPPVLAVADREKVRRRILTSFKSSCAQRWSGGYSLIGRANLSAEQRGVMVAAAMGCLRADGVNTLTETVSGELMLGSLSGSGGNAGGRLILRV